MNNDNIAQYDWCFKTLLDFITKTSKGRLHRISPNLQSIEPSDMTTLKIDATKIPDRIFFLQWLSGVTDTLHIEFQNDTQLKTFDRFSLYQINIRDLTEKNVISIIIYFDRVPTRFANGWFHWYTHKIPNPSLSEIHKTFNTGKTFSTDITCPFLVLNLKKCPESIISKGEEINPLFSVLRLFQKEINISAVLEKLSIVELENQDHSKLVKVLTKLFSNKGIKVDRSLLNNLKLSSTALGLLIEVGEEQRTTDEIAYERGKNDGYTSGKNDGYTSGKNDGYTSGKDDGVQEGILKGILKGKEEGEYLKALDMAKEMLEEGFPIDQVLRISKLEMKDIAQFIKTN